MLKKLFFAFFFSFFFILSINSVFAVTAGPLRIELNKTEFGANEEVSSKIVFTNTYDKEIKGQLICDLVYADDPMLYPPGPRQKTFDLKPGESVSMECTNSTGEGMPEGIYHLTVEARDEHNNIMIDGYKEVLITGIKQEIQAEMQTCADKDCANNKAVFMAGEDVNIFLQTNEPDLSVTAQLLNNKREVVTDLQFADNKAIVKAPKEGGYIASINLKKEGLIDKTIEKDFAVIEKPAEIKSISECNGDGKCDKGENIQNCPQDCIKIKSGNKNLLWIIISIILIFLAVLIISIWYIRKRKADLNTAN